jgi:pimeloyl-ACP methyl ester carboxylesterase
MLEHIPIYRNEETKSKFFSFYKEALATWPVPYEELMVQTSYGNTHAISSGPKQASVTSAAAAAIPIVLLHAAGTNATMWSPNVAALSSTFHLYAIDTIGDLGKSVLKDADYYPKTSQDYGRWLTDVFDGLGIKQAFVIGSSMGGWITHSLALFASERIRKIVLLDPAAGIPTRTTWATMFLLAAIFPFKSNYRRIVRKLLGNSIKEGEGGEEKGKKLWFDYMVTAFASKVKPRLGMPTKFSDQELTKTKVPILLLIGQEEVIYGSIDATIERARRLIPHIQVEIIPNAGHLPNMDQPSLVNTMILKFLAE